MIKRPLNPKFTAAVREGRKITTIREKPWPVGRPIMLYNWSGKPYASPQVDVGEIVVEEMTPIHLWLSDHGDLLWAMQSDIVAGRRLWQCEGFDSMREMEDWFCPLLKPGKGLERHVMRFRLVRGAGGNQ